MMRVWSCLALAILLLLVPGCSDRLNLENLALVFMTGIDVNEKNELLVYYSNPVFHKEAKKKSEEFHVKAVSLRNARGPAEAITTSSIAVGKLQVVIVSKRLLQRKDWFSLFDVVFRDAKYNVNARLVAADDIGDIFQSYPSDKPRLPIQLKKMIDTASHRSDVSKTTMLQFQQQYYENGVTPYITEVHKKDGNIAVKGTLLLHRDGSPAFTMSINENKYMDILRKHIPGDFSLTVSVPAGNVKDGIDYGRLSFFLKKDSRTIKVSHANGRFKFDIDVKLKIAISERLFPFDMEHNLNQLEEMVAKEMQDKMAAFIQKLQKNRVDPIGLGIYARAFQYQDWKRVKGHWPEAFAKADIRLHTKVSIQTYGLTK